MQYYDVIYLLQYLVLQTSENSTSITHFRLLFHLSTVFNKWCTYLQNIASPVKWASTHSWNKMALLNYSFELLILCINVLSINAVPKAFSSSEGPCWERKKMQLCNVKPYLCVCCRISGFSLIAESQCALMHWPFALYTRCRCAGVWGHLRTAFTTSQRYNCSSSS